MKLFAGRHATRGYPGVKELQGCGRDFCGVNQPADVIGRIAAAMEETLVQARGDSRIEPSLLQQMQDAWQSRLAYAP